MPMHNIMLISCFRLKLLFSPWIHIEYQPSVKKSLLDNFNYLCPESSLFQPNPVKN